MKQVGFFGGSFDPIHFGHINLAIQLLEHADLDEILFCPAHCSPFKVDHPPVASAAHRLEMLKRVLADLPQCSATSIEMENPGPSYTIDTLRKLQNPQIAFRLILSEEAACFLSKWKEYEELIRLAPPLIGARKGESRIELPWEVIETSCFDISSTDIRERLKKGLYCEHLIPHKALDYILQNHLYSTR